MSLTLTTAAVIALLSQGTQSPQGTIEPRLMRTPAIQGDTIVFSYAGDLWVTKAGSGVVARRLTSHPGQEIRPKISPDGKWVSFNGMYDGNQDIYIIPIEGGEPRRLTYEPEGENNLGWTHDGKIAYASTNGSFTNRQQRMWLVDPQGGMPIRTAIEEVSEASFFPDGKSMAYTRFNSYNFNWRRYRGGSQGRISLYDFDKNAYSELPARREQSYFPMVAGRSVFYISDRNLATQNLYRYDLDTKKEAQITKFADADVRWPSTDGKSIVFERDGFLYIYDVASGNMTRQAPKILSENLSARPLLRPLASSISSVSLSPSGARVAVEARGELFSVPAKAGDTRNMTGTSGARERFPRWAPDGKAIAYVSDKTGNWEIYTQPQLGGEATAITVNSGLPINGIEWSPDSKYLQFSTEANELWIVEAATKKLTKIAKGNYGIGDTDWSPDSKWIAVVLPGANQLGALHLYDVGTAKLSKVTEGYYSDNGVAFDQNGKYLYMTSTRSFAPSFGQYEFSLKVQNADRIYVLPLAADTPNPLVSANEEEPEGPPQRPAGAPGGPGGGPGGPPQPAPVKVDLPGLGDRAIALPLPPSAYPFILGSTNGVFFAALAPGAPPSLSRFDLGTRETTPLMPLIGGLAFNANRSKVVVHGGGNMNVLDVRPGMTPAQGRVDLSSVEAVFDPREEWKQMFWDAWRYQRDNFYDPQMLGLDWMAIGKRYEAYLPYVAHRADLNYVIGQMVGELGTGHSYVSGGDFGAMGTPVPVGQLGADFESDRGFVRFKKIYRGQNFEESRRGPLGEPGIDIKDGEYLIAIDGKAVNTKVHPSSLLVNKAGKFVTLTVNSTPTESGARKVRVRAIGSEGSLRYAEWVEENRRKVAQLSGGRIGYMHVPDTATQGAIEFIRGYYSQTDKDAMIVDERWNGGGFIQPWFVDTLARRMRAGIQQRNALDAGDAVAIEGPKVMLINGYAGSGGDFFPWMFRQQKLGPLIGARTWGGLVGIAGNYGLVDGGQVSSPEFAIYDRETGNIIAENTGVDPDIEVDMRPDLVAQGKDPQLEAAVNYLVEQLKKMPPKKNRMTIPKVGPQGRTGG